jgi:hypothetical protein
LAEAGMGMEFHVLRSEAAPIHFRLLRDASIVGEDLSFTFVDEDYAPGSTYRYRVDVSDEDGRRTLFETNAIVAPLGSLSLDQNYPNPFNPTTTISFVLPERGDVVLSIFDVAGALVSTLVEKPLEEGLNEFTWDGKDSYGNPVGSGIYFYRLKVGKKTITKKMLLLK